MRTCKKCGLSQAIELFPKHKTGYRHECHKCVYIRSQKSQLKWRLKNIVVARKKDSFVNLKRLYGVTREQYESMVESQNGTCYLCHRPNGSRKLCVDHDHVTGKIRKLLCGACNSAIGQLQENVELIRLAAKYIEDHR